MTPATLKTLTSSKKMDWSTPQGFFDELNQRFSFTLDVAADEWNAKLLSYLSEEEDALECDWFRDVCWCNPPYGRGIGDWVDKAVSEAEKGATIVMLVPSRTDTQWFARAWAGACEVLFVHGRLKFSEGDTAPFPSVVFVFRPSPRPVFTVGYLDTRGRRIS